MATFPTVCFGIFTAPHQKEEKAVTIQAKLKPSTIMWVLETITFYLMPSID